jgi:hypothetical protein
VAGADLKTGKSTRCYKIDQSAGYPEIEVSKPDESIQDSEINQSIGDPKMDVYHGDELHQFLRLMSLMSLHGILRIISRQELL